VSRLFPPRRTVHESRVVKKTANKFMSQNQIRWGILGAANIARKNWKAIANTGNGVVTAVASRNIENTRRFIQECQSEAPMPVEPRSLDRYEDVLAASDVDAVYIPLPTGVRKEWVIRAAEAGKHVVCEKPCAPTLEDLRVMTDACRHNGVQFMDGVMFVHSTRLDAIRLLLDDAKTVGQLNRIDSAFTFCGDEGFAGANIRMNSVLEPLGCLGDLGWYCIRLALWAMKWQMPVQVSGLLLAEAGRPDSPTPVPTVLSGELVFENGVTSGFYCSFVTGFQQWAHLSGPQGSVNLSDFVLPFSGNTLAIEVQNAVFKANGCDFSMTSNQQQLLVQESSHGQADSQETNLFRNFATQVLSGKLNDAWPEFALKTQAVVNACLESARNGGRAVKLQDW
jgi:predicted dehydrogenase